MSGIFDDRELVETFQDEPELLAIADAFATTMGGRTRDERRRRRGRRLAVGGMLLAAAVAAVVLFGLTAGSKSFTDRALAAVAPVRIVHAVVSYDSPVRTIDLRTGATQSRRLIVEDWFDSQTHQALFVSRSVGRITEVEYTDQAGRQFTSRGRLPGPAHPGRIDLPIASFLDGYRAALADRRVEVAGDATIDGRRVRWLELLTASGALTSRVAVDVSTYQPIRVEAVSAGRVIDQYAIDQINSLEQTSVFRRPAVRSHEETAGAILHSRSVPLSLAQAALGGKLLVPTTGYRFTKATIDTVQLKTLTGTSRTIGVTLHYSDATGNQIRIQEANRGHVAYGWPGWLATNPLPSGVLYEDMQAGTTLFRGGGTFVTISGGLGNPQSIAALARTLARG